MKFSDNVLEVMENICKTLDKDKDGKFYVDNRELILYLKDWEIDIPSDIVSMYRNEFGNGVLQYMELLSGEDMELFSGGNSYNHSGNIFRDIDFRTCETENGKYLVAIQMHIGGDIRANYTDFFLLEFDFDTQFYEVLSDFENEQSCFDYKYNGKEFYITPRIFSEILDIYCVDNEEDIYCIYAINEEDLERQLDLCFLYEKSDIDIANYILNNAEDKEDMEYLIDKIERYSIEKYTRERILNIKDLINKK